MKRLLLLVSFLSIIGSMLYAQTQAADQGQGQTAPATNPRPWAQVIVTPNPQGGPPTVNSYIAPWPLGTVLEDTFSQVFPAPGTADTVTGGPAPAEAQSLQNGGTQTQDPAQSTVQTRSTSRPATRPAAQTPAQAPSSQSGAVPSSQQSSKQVVVPSPVHYDRAGRRVIEPGWQDTLTQIVRSEREAAANEAANAAAAGAAADGTAANAATDTGAAGNEAPGEAEGVQPTEPVRETIIVVPGPTTWRIPGILTVAKGMLALDGDDGVLWYLPGLERYIGFIDGLDAGEAVILEGYASAMGSSQERYFQPTRIFIDDMGYDLSIPPYGLLAQPYLTNPSGQTLIREAAPLTGTTRDPSPAAGRNDAVQNGQSETGQNGQGQAAQNSRDETRPPWSRRESPSPQAPVWQHNHTSPWAPPTSVFDFDPDYDDSFWQDDPAKLEQRERDSREIWY